MYLFPKTVLILKELSQFLTQSLTSDKPIHPAPLKQAGSLPQLSQFLYLLQKFPVA